MSSRPAADRRMHERANATGWRQAVRTMREGRGGALAWRWAPGLAVLYTATVGSLFIALAPMLWGGYSTYLKLSDERIGDLMSGEFLGYTIATVAGIFYMDRPGLDLRRVIYAALGVYVLGNAVTPHLFASAQGLIAVRVLCGLSAGTSYMAAATAITGLGSPPRLVATFYGAPFITAAILQPLAQPVFGRLGFASAFDLIAIAAAASIAVYGFFPRFAESRREASGSTPPGARSGVLVGALSIGLLLQYIANSGIWLCFDRIGVLSGHAAQTAADIVGVGSGMSLIGTWLAALLAPRARPVACILWGTAAIILSTVTLHQSTYLPLFAGSVAVFNAMITFLTPFYFILLVKVYSPARAVLIGNICMAVGFCAGPQLIRYTVQDTDFTRSINVTVAIFVVSAALVILFDVLNERADPTGGAS